jgi:hypothetical protein
VVVAWRVAPLLVAVFLVDALVVDADVVVVIVTATAMTAAENADVSRMSCGSHGDDCARDDGGDGRDTHHGVGTS